MLSLTVPIQLRFADLDPRGHVNHVAYLAFMETARLRFMHTHAGALQGNVLVAHAECDYRHEVPASSLELEVVVGIERVGRSSFVVHHDIREAGRTVAEGRVVMVALGADGRPREITEQERLALLEPG